jgi:predicted MPP superfamily phosphohydrolase
MGTAPTFASMEWSGWTVLRDRWTALRQRSALQTFQFDLAGPCPRWGDGQINVTDQRIWLNGLPESFRGFRILQLSDIHHSRYFRLDRVAEMVELSNSLRPDLVALTGDFVTYSRASIEPVAEMLGAIRARAGIVAVLGNHDFRVGAGIVERALRRHGIEVLRNRHILLRARGEILPVAGVDDYRYGADLDGALKGIPAGLPTVLLAHNPRLLHLAAGSGVSLVLSGHTHGGQVNLPLLGTIYGRSPERLRFKGGWDVLGGTQIYVSRGIGTIVLPWRLRCPAEIPWLELQPHSHISPLLTEALATEDYPSEWRQLGSKLNIH